MEKLTKAEEEIMHIVWKLERCTVRDIINELGIKIAHSTVSSVVRILEKKGFVSHKAYGKTYEYFSIVEKETYSKNRLQGFIQNYFSGSFKDMVSFLVKEENLSIEELNDIIKGLDEDK